MRPIINIYCCVVLNFYANAQQFQVEPQKPTATNSINFQYDSRPFFEESSNISCIVYFTGLNDRTKQRDDFPLTQTITLKKVGLTWHGKIDSIPPRASAVVFVFIDSNNNRDINNGKGYYSFIYDNNKPVRGAWAGIGSLLYGNWNTKQSKFHIKFELDSATKFLMRDISLYPELKREYIGLYLNTLKIISSYDEKNYRKELEEISQWPDISHNELLLLRSEYARLKDTINSNICERQIFEKYPNASWTVQAKSLKSLIAIGSSHDFDQQIKIYKQFKDTYLKSYDDELATIRMNGRAAQMLGYMLEHFINDGTIDLWLNEVEHLTDDGKIRAFQTAARDLLGLTERSGGTKQDAINVPLEHLFFRNSLEEPDRKTKIASDLAAQAVAIGKKNFNEPRKHNEPLIMTDAEVRDFRNRQLSWHLEILGVSFMKQNKFEEAVKVLADAVQRNNYEESSINQTYIESLINNGQVVEALSEIENIVARGKSTTVIDNFYSKYKKENTSIDKLKLHSIENAKRLMRQKLLREDAPEFSYYDLDGNELKSSLLKNKIVVIDFWASWCGPCMIALDAAQQVMEKYNQDPEIVFLLMDEDLSKERAMKVIELQKNKSAFVFDPEHELIKKYAANLPSQIVIDKNGKVRFRTNGLTTFNVQENAIELMAMIELLKE